MSFSSLYSLYKRTAGAVMQVTARAQWRQREDVKISLRTADEVVLGRGSSQLTFIVFIIFPIIFISFVKISISNQALVLKLLQ